MGFNEQFAAAAAVTSAVELAAAFLLASRVRLLLPRLRIAAVVLLANALTVPALWYLPGLIHPAALEPHNHALYLVLGGIAVPAVETATYWLLLFRHRPWLAVTLSAVANVSSYAVGVVLHLLLRSAG
jgi:hypothetical protein